MQCARNYEKYKGRVKMSCDSGFHTFRRQEISGVERLTRSKKEDKRRYAGTNHSSKALR